MKDPDLIGLFIEPVERAGVSYMITGGVAAVVYGDPRFTRDIDLVMELPEKAASKLASTFHPTDFYVPPVEVLVEEAARRRGGHVNVIHRDTALRADIYFAGDEPLHAWAFERRQRIRVGALAIWLAPVEYVILRKLEYFQDSGAERHLRDVAMILRISGDLVDSRVLGDWSVKLELEDALEAGRRYPTT